MIIGRCTAAHQQLHGLVRCVGNIHCGEPTHQWPRVTARPLRSSVSQAVPAPLRGITNNPAHDWVNFKLHVAQIIALFVVISMLMSINLQFLVLFFLYFHLVSCSFLSTLEIIAVDNVPSYQLCNNSLEFSI